MNFLSPFPSFICRKNEEIVSYLGLRQYSGSSRCSGQHTRGSMPVVFHAFLPGIRSFCPVFFSLLGSFCRFSSPKHHAEHLKPAFMASARAPICQGSFHRWPAQTSRHSSFFLASLYKECFLVSPRNSYKTARITVLPSRGV